MSLVLVPKGEGKPINVLMRFESLPTQYVMTAQISGAVQALVKAGANMEANSTDIYFKVNKQFPAGLFLIESTFQTGVVESYSLSINKIGFFYLIL